MLLTIGFIMLTRLSFDSARKQYFIALVSMIFSLINPVDQYRDGFVRKLYWLFAIVGILALLVVTIAGNTSYGAKISLSIAGISIQPSEFVKILFVFFVAGMLYQDTSFQQPVPAGHRAHDRLPHRHRGVLALPGEPLPPLVLHGAGESKYPLKKMLSFAMEGITSLSVKPIRYITGLGFLIFAVSILISH